MSSRFLTALPIYNEVNHVTPVLDEVLRYSPEVLVVDDGSTDGTSELLAARHDIRRVTHEKNRGYGAALAVGVRIHAGPRLRRAGDDRLRRPAQAAADSAVRRSGRRRRHRLRQPLSGNVQRRQPAAGRAPADQSADHRRAESPAWAEPDRRLLRLQGLSRLGAGSVRHHRAGYAMPLEVWVQAAHAKLKIVELPVPLIYLGRRAFVRRLARRRPQAAGVLS